MLAYVRKNITEVEYHTWFAPMKNLGVQEGDAGWAALSPADQAGLRGQPGVCVRYAGGRVLALLHVDPHSGSVLRSEGDAFHLARLTRDVTRALGTQALGTPAPETQAPATGEI